MKLSGWRGLSESLKIGIVADAAGQTIIIAFRALGFTGLRKPSTTRKVKIMDKPKTDQNAASQGTSASPCSEVEWQTAALEILDALRAMSAFYADLAKSNPGFMGKLCLQDYGLWNDAMLKKSAVLRKYGDLPNSDLGR